AHLGHALLSAVSAVGGGRELRRRWTGAVGVRYGLDRARRGAGARRLVGAEFYALRPAAHGGDLRSRDRGGVRHQRHGRVRGDVHPRRHAGGAGRSRDGAEDFRDARHRRRGDRAGLRGGGDRRHGLHRRRAGRVADRRAVPRRVGAPRPAARALRHLRRHGAGAGVPAVWPVHASAAAEDLTGPAMRDAIGAVIFVLLAVAAPFLPAWIVSLATIAFANALVVLGLVILWRAGL